MTDISNDDLISAVDFLSQLKGEWKWREGEVRCGYGEEYKELCDLIDRLNNDIIAK